MVKKAKKKWFIPVRGSYLPNSWQGWLTYIPFIAFLACVAIIGWRYSGNNALAVLYIIPNWVAGAVVMTWVASRTS